MVTCQIWIGPLDPIHDSDFNFKKKLKSFLVHLTWFHSSEGLWVATAAFSLSVPRPPPLLHRAPPL